MDTVCVSSEIAIPHFCLPKSNPNNGYLVPDNDVFVMNSSIVSGIKPLFNRLNKKLLEDINLLRLIISQGASKIHGRP